jgi:predicted phosphodiesterase
MRARRHPPARSLLPSPDRSGVPVRAGATIDMKVAVISDIHANLQALEAVLDAIGESEAQELWCLGDLVGYGGDPDPCVGLIAGHAAVCLGGNHDMAVVGKLPFEDFSRGASLAAQWTREVIAPDSLAFLASLQPQASEDHIGLYHASPRNPEWEYVLSALLANLCMDVQSERIALIGHSHVALSFTRYEGETATGEPRREGTELDISRGEWLLNPGSVGQPRDGDPRAAWLLLDLDEHRASFMRTPYDIAGAAGAIRAAHLPDSLAERLQYGQ